MLIVGLILLLIGSLVPGLDPRAKNAMVVIGIILLIVGAILYFTPYRL